MMRHDPNHMTEEKVAEKWADYMDMQDDASVRLGLSEREVNPIPKEEMVERNMVFMGNVPIIEPTSD